MKIIENESDIKAGIEALRKADPRLEPMIDKAGLPPVRRNPGGFEGLCRIIVAQQLSVASANAIWTRVETTLSPCTMHAMADADEATLKSCGLSAPKIRTLRAIAIAAKDGLLPFETMGDMPADAAHAKLTAVKGIGPWTADIYLMFCIGHADAFAAGDLALQEAVKLGFGLENRPTAKELAAIAEGWRPWRAIAARLLWAYYRVAKTRSGII